jgi:subtilisin-like proprotein convertase family protein
MRSLFKTAALLAMTTLLVNCGGGGAPSAQSVAATCDSTTLWATPSIDSGRGIPDNNTTGTSVSWDNQNCQIRSVTSAFIEVCLNHSSPSDLTWSVVPPNSGTSTSLTVSGNWLTNSTTCSSSGDKFQRIDLLSSLSSNVATSGTWQLQVKDLMTGDSGTLNQWRVIIQGNR